jgi:hypothetical protein
MFRRTCTAITALTLLMLPLFAFAAEATCTCFCGLDGVGAQALQDPVTPSVCQSDCAAVDATMVVCATDATEYPSNTATCFDEDSCANQGGELDDSYQPAQCIPGQHFCYPIDTTPLTLSVAIGSKTTATDVGDYVKAFYSYGLGIATTIAIVFVMIGGLQYVLAAGSGDTAKAKARIRNAVIGLLLLLFSWVILYTVNPRLVLLKVPKFPMVHRIEYLGGQQSCEYLMGEFAAGAHAGQDYKVENGALSDSPYVGLGYVIDDEDGDATVGQYGAQLCGSTSIVSTDYKGNAVTEGTTCQYEACKDKEALCYGTAEQANCLTCTDVIPNAIPGLTPSESVCGSLALPDVLAAGGNTKNYCFLTNDPSVLISGWAVLAAASVPLTAGLSLPILTAAGYTTEQATLLFYGACAQMSINCADINSCADYGSVDVTTGATSDKLENLEPGLGSGVTNMQTICSGDPCGAAQKEGKTSCSWVEAGWLSSSSCEGK